MGGGVELWGWRDVSAIKFKSKSLYCSSKDLSSIPSFHLSSSQPPAIPATGDLTPLASEVPTYTACAHTDTHTHMGKGGKGPSREDWVAGVSVRKESSQSIPTKKGTGTVPILYVTSCLYGRKTVLTKRGRNLEGGTNTGHWGKRTFIELGLCLPTG